MTRALESILLHPCMGWAGAGLQQDTRAGALRPPPTAFIGREAQEEGKA